MTRSNLSQLRDFVGSLGDVKGDLSNITAPPFALSTKSTTEIPVSWAERHKLFLQPSKEEDAEVRALLVLKNYLCSLKRQAFASSIDKSGSGGPKKPLNAFLGELFLGKLEDAETASKTHFISEQVSHHPPVTACFMYNKAHRMSSSGYVAQETTFSPSTGVVVKQIGHAIVRDETHGESHLMTLPTMAIKGFLTGKLYPEFHGSCYVSSTSGYLATVTFEGTNTLGFGAKNKVYAKLCSLRDNSRCLFEISGQWDGKMKIARCSDAKVLEEFDVDQVPLAEIKVEPLEAQSPWESRRAWHGVGEGVKAGDMRAVTEAKGKIENAQRDMRSVEEETGVKWPRLFFTQAPDHQEFKVLAKVIPDAESRMLHEDRTAGIWKFIGIPAAEKLIRERAFYGGLKPSGQETPE